MSEPFFNSSEKIKLLADVAETWKGTPFVANGEVKQGGASCQTLVGAILKECGHLPSDFKLPHGAMNHSSSHKTSIMEPVFDAMKDQFADVTGKHPMPGDVLGLKWGACVHHLGIMIDYDRFVHVAVKMRYGAMISSIRDASYSQHIKRIWRPIK